MEATVILGISILLQLSAATLALSLIKFTGRQRAWIAIAAAILLMAVRRSITFARLVTGDGAHPPDPAAEFVALTISVLMVVGLASIAPIFRRRKSAFKK